MIISSTLFAYYLHQVTTPSYFDSTTQARPAIVSSEQDAAVANYTVIQHGTIPPGASRVLMGVIEISADCDNDIDLYSFTLQRRGLGQREDIESVYLEENGIKIARSRPIAQKDGTVTISVRNGYVPPCQKRQINVYADFSSEASLSARHSIELQQISSSKQIRILQLATAQPIIRPRIASTGTLNTKFLSLNRRVSFGPNKIVSRFQLSADRESDQQVHSIRLTNKGSARFDNLQNIQVLSSRRRPVSFISPQMNGDTVTINFSPPLLIEKSQSKTFLLIADVFSGASKTIDFSIEDTSDIQASPYRSRRR